MERAEAINERQYDVFVRKARDSARQCLFFLYDLEELGRNPRYSKLNQDAAFALRQARALVDGVHIPTRIATAARAGTFDQMPAAVPVKRREAPRLVDFFVESDGAPAELFELTSRMTGRLSRRERLTKFVRDDQHREGGLDADWVKARDELLHFWARRIWRDLHSTDELDPERTRYFILQFQAFLRISRPTNTIQYFTMLVEKLGVLLLRNIAVLLGCIGLLAVWTREELASLVLNGGAYSLYPFLVVLLGGMVSLLVGDIAHLRLGKSAFFRVAFHAEEPERGVDAWPQRSEIRRLIGWSEIIKLMLILGWLLLGGVVFWALSADPTQRTMFALASLSWLVLVALHWLDLWDFLDPRPIRFFVLLGLLVLGAGVLTGRHREAGYVLFGSTLAWWCFNFWRKRWASKVSYLAAVFCVFNLISLFLGGRTLENSTWSESNLHTRVGPHEWPFPGTAPVVLITASGGGSRAAIYTALTLKSLQMDPELHAIATNIQAISSVSGGSLTAAAYTALLSRSNPTNEADWSGLVDAVSLDFLYPTLVGALVPGTSRGDEIEKYWDEHVGLKDLTLLTLADRWRSALEASPRRTTPPFPMLLLNSSTLDGHAVVISPLARDVYLDKYDAVSRVEELRGVYGLPATARLTWVLDRDRVYPLELLNKTANPKLSEAVRASANFPFGFPLVDVQTDGPYPLGAADTECKHFVSMTDGGVLSNSGLWTMFHLLTHVDQQQQLKKRGVLLIVIDASKMPEYDPDRRNFGSLYGAIGDKSPVGQNMHRKLFELLFQEYGKAIKVVQIDVIPSAEDNVYTTWALDKAAQARLSASFSRVWNGPNAKAQVREKLKNAWAALAPEPQHATPLLTAQKVDARNPPNDTGARSKSPCETSPISAERIDESKRQASAADLLRPPLD